LGRLITQPIPTLYQGVSRQPDVVRLPGQVEEATNTALSVVTGGFSKRLPTTHLLKTGLTAGTAKTMHVYRRDASEEYAVVFINGDLKVYNTLTGVEATVSFPSGKGYLSSNPDDMVALTIADHTLVLNKAKTVTKQAAGSQTIYGPVKDFGDLPRAGDTVPAYLSSYDVGATANKWDSTDTGCTNGAIWKVDPEDGDKLGYYYVKLSTGGSLWSWSEWANVNESYNFTFSTMPWKLVRTGVDTFTFDTFTWDERQVGDLTTVPFPSFVDTVISDIVLFRNRLGMVTDENVEFSEAGDYFNFFPRQSTAVSDADPLAVSADSGSGSGGVNLLRYAVPFSRSLFLTADSAQFIATSGDALFTPRTARVEPATSYQIDNGARPAVMGEVLYFGASDGADGVVWEYFLSDGVTLDRASDVSRHVKSYIPSGFKIITGDPTSGSLFVLSSSALDTLYVYNVFWNGDEKVQSSWHKWTFSGGTIRGAKVSNSRLILLIERNSEVHLEILNLADAEADTFDFTVLLDRKVSLTGTYDAGNDWTTWTLPYAHGSLTEGYLNNSHAAAKRGKKLVLTYPTTTTVRSAGDHSAAAAIFGQPYTMSVTLSKQFYRPDGKTALIEGRAQMQRMRLNMINSGYLEAIVTPEGRDPYTHKFTGRIMGSSVNQVSKQPIVDQVFSFGVGTNAATVTIELRNASHVPCTVTSAVWEGIFNERIRQG
jgi:hypothetical protein